MRKIVLVVPCYNEAERLSVGRFVDALDRELPPGTEYLFVDDGSTDGTRAVLETIVGRAGGRACSLALPRNVGKGEAVRQGLLAALRDDDVGFVGFWDADLATPLDHVATFLAVLRERKDVGAVIGTRIRLCGREVDRDPIRGCLGRVFATVVAWTLAAPVYDSQCGAKLLRVTDGLAGAVSRPFVSRWIFDVELIARLLRAGGGLPFGGIYEVPLERWVDVSGSKVGPAAYVRAAFELARIARRERPWEWRTERSGATEADRSRRSGDVAARPAEACDDDYAAAA